MGDVPLCSHGHAIRAYCYRCEQHRKAALWDSLGEPALALLDDAWVHLELLASYLFAEQTVHTNAMATAADIRALLERAKEQQP